MAIRMGVISLIALALMACGGRHATPATPPPTAAEWKAVIQDWYDNRKFTHRHSCAATRAALEHVPADGTALAVADALRRYESRVC